MKKTTNRPFFWVWGAQRHCRQTWEKIVSHVKEKTGEDPNIQILFGGFNPQNSPPHMRWSGAEDVINILRNKDMFNRNSRITKVYGLPENYTLLYDWFDVVNSKNILVLQSPFGYTQIGSKRWVTAKTSNLYKKVEKDGFLLDLPLEVNNSDAVAWVQELAAEHKKEIDRDVAGRLVELHGTNLDLLENAVGKVCIYQKSKKLSLEDVEACCITEMWEDKVWTFIEDLDMKRVDQVFTYLHGFYEQGDGTTGETFYGRINRLFGALTQHYQFLLFMKDASSLDATKIEQDLSGFKKTNPTLLKQLQNGAITNTDLEPKFNKRFIAQNLSSPSVQSALRRKKSEIYRIVDDLQQCMCLCRMNSGQHYYLKLCLDTFALVVCGEIGADDAIRIRGGLYNNV